MKKEILLLLFIVTSSMMFAQNKTAHVNTKLLMDTLPSRKKASIEIQEIAKRSESELLEMDKQLQKAYNDYMANKAGWTQTVIQYEENRLQKMQQDMQSREQELTNTLKNMTASMNSSSYSIIQNAVKIIATKKGYQYVIDEGTVLYAGGTDITNEVLTELLQIDIAKSK